MSKARPGLILAAAAAVVIAASIDRAPPAPAAAQRLGCPPAVIYLPLARRDSGVALDPGTPAPRPTFEGPCPGGTASPTATRTAASTPAQASATPSPSPTPTGAGGTPANPSQTATASSTGPTPTPSSTPTGPQPSETATPRPSATPSGSPTPRPTPTMTPTPLGGLFGVQAYQGDLAPLWDGTLTAAGISWVRLEAFWRVIEPEDTTPAAYNWGALDHMVEGAMRGRLTPLVVIYTKPAWAATRSCGPVDRVPWDRYGDFVRDLVERYDGDGVDDAPNDLTVKHWEIGNEPDFAPSRAGGETDYGSCYGDDPAAYGDELRTAHAAAKAADAEAQVVFGAVAYDRFYDRADFSPAGPFRYTFVQDAIAALKRDHGDEPGWPFFDSLGFHNYNDFRNNWDGPDGRDPEIIGKAKHLRQNQLVLSEVFDLSTLPLLASEMGITSGPSDNFTERSETFQAAYVGQVMIRSAAAGLQAAIWYTASDRNVGACDQVYDWLAHGLLRTRFVADRVARCPTNPLPGYTAGAAFEPKPALTAFKTMGQLLSRATYGRQLTVAETGAIDLEAHAFTLADGRSAIAAFADNSERLGRRGSTIETRTLRLTAGLLPGWTGRVRVIDYLGAERVETESGAEVAVEVGFAPVYAVVER